MGSPPRRWPGRRRNRLGHTHRSAPAGRTWTSAPGRTAHAAAPSSAPDADPAHLAPARRVSRRLLRAVTTVKGMSLANELLVDGFDRVRDIVQRAVDGLDE